MTDKEQIIVDRVDVSECKYLNKVVNEEPYCNIDEEHLYTCSSDENCYFKQLARKTQECEELQKQLMQKSEVDMFFNTPIEGWSNDPCGICKYKNCLTEIKGIAEENIRIADLEGLNGVYRRGLAKQILQKISEVENETK